MKIAFYTLGCKLNQSESEALADSFRGQGFFIVLPSETAQIYVVNSCTVTSKAEQKARRMIRKFSATNSDSIIIVTGCYAQMNSQQISQLGENIIVTGMDGKSRLNDLPKFIKNRYQFSISLLNLVKEFFNLEIKHDEKSRFRFQNSQYSYHSRAFVKIQDGCDNSCSYCRVQIARGKAVSLELVEVLKQIEAVLQSGYKEIVLTGVNISAWKSLDSKKDLADLIIGVADIAVSYSARIRLSSLEPDRLDDKLLDALSHKGVAPHFHIPLQTLSQSVLERMNRHYLITDVLKWIKKLRTKIDNPFLAADIISGFDGESDIEFNESFSLMKKLGFAHLHVFPFSPREGTISYKPKHPVAERIRDERAAKYRQLSTNLNSTYQNESIGREEYLLVENIKENENDYILTGITGNYLRPLLKLSTSKFRELKIEKKQLIKIKLLAGGEARLI